MNLEEFVDNHHNLTLGNLGDVKTSEFFKIVDELGLADKFTADTLIMDVPGIIATLPPDQAMRLRGIDIQFNATYTQTVNIPPNATQGPALNDLKAIATIPSRESRGRLIIGSLFCLVMAFTIIIFTVSIAQVALHRMEFPSTTLCAVIVIPTMMVAWFYMGIINKERRDILSALVGNKISPNAVAAVVEALRKPRN